MGYTVTQQPQGQIAVQQLRTSCKHCSGPIIYERNMCSLVRLVVCCGCVSLFCLPKRETECASCGAKQGYSIPNSHSC